MVDTDFFPWAHFCEFVCLGWIYKFAVVHEARSSLVAHEGEQALDREVDVAVALLEHLKIGSLVSEAHLL